MVTIPLFFKKTLILLTIILFALSLVKFSTVPIVKATITDNNLINSLAWSSSPFFWNTSTVSTSSPFIGNMGVVSSNLSDTCKFNGTQYGSSSAVFYAYKHSFTFYLPSRTLTYMNAYDFGTMPTSDFSYTDGGGIFYVALGIDETSNTVYYHLHGMIENNYGGYGTYGDYNAMEYGKYYSIEELVLYGNYNSTTLFHNILVYDYGFLEVPAHLLSNTSYAFDTAKYTVYNWNQSYTFATFSCAIAGTMQNNIFYSNIQYTENATYTYALSPNPISVGTFQIYPLLELYQGQSYLYTGNVYLSGDSNINGTYNITSSGILVGLFPNYLRSPKIDFPFHSVLGNTSFTSGTFTFTLSPRNGASDIISESIEIIITFSDSSTFSALYVIDWYNYNYVNPRTEENQNTGGGQETQLGNFFIDFIIIFIPSMFMGIYFGRNGFFIGLVLVSGIGWISGLMPIWFIFLAGIGLILLLFSNVDIGGMIRH